MLFWRLRIIGLAMVFGLPLMAQQPADKPVTTILLPLQLDSLFQYEQYKYGNTLPKFALPYLEFYNGVQFAADSLRKEGIAAHLNVVDTRKAGLTVAQVLQDPQVRKSKLLIGVAQSGAELKLMTDYARQLHIPFISATYPNDGGVKDNKQMFLVNSTLRTHCFSIYRYLQTYHSTEKLVVFTRKGTVEPYIKSWLEEAARNTRSVRLNWQFVSLPDSVNASNVKYLLDSTRNNVILGASLDVEFGKQIVRTLASLKPTYRSLLMGMPTWDEIDLRKPEFKGMDVMYSTPFVSLSANLDAYNSLARHYATNLNSRPSDMAVKGFELTYRFVKTIVQWQQPDSFAAHINDRTARIFCDFSFEPVTDAGNPAVVNYYENKKLYFIKKTDGHVKGIY